MQPPKMNFKITRTQAETLYQEGMDLYHAAKCEAAIDNFEQANAFFIATQSWIEQVRCQNSLSACYNRLGKNEQAIEYLQKSLDLYALHQLKIDEELVITYRRLAANYSSLKNKQKAFECIDKALEIAYSHLGEEHSETISVLNSKGWMYSSIGDYGQAIHYFEKALPICIKQEKWDLTSVLYNNIAYNLKMLDNFEKALPYFQKAIQIVSQQDFQKHIPTVSSYLNLGECLSELNKLQEAKKNYDIALQNSLEGHGEMHYMTAICYSCLGNWEIIEEAYLEAQRYFEKALKIYETTYGKFYGNTALTLIRIANCYHYLQDFETALHYHQQALSRIWKREDLTRYPYQNIDLPFTDKPLLIFKALRWKAKNLLHLYLQNGDEKALTTAFETSQLNTKWIQKIRQSFQSAHSKLQWTKDVYDYYEVYIRILAQMLELPNQQSVSKNMLPLPSYLLKKAFEASEQNKSLLLFSNLINQAAKINAQISPSLLQKEKKLLEEITRLEQELLQQEAKKEQNTDSNWVKNKAKLADSNIQYTELIHQLEADYPGYYQLKHQVKTITIPEIQQKINSKTALIEYFVGKESLFIISITERNAFFNKIALPPDFDNLIEDFRSSLLMGDDDLLSETSSQLYELLIAPIRTDVLLKRLYHPTITDLIIIPQDDLYYIPFELLQYTQNDTDRLLIEDYNITYHYSATLWHYGIQRQSKTAHQADSFFGLAPVSFSKKSESTAGYIAKSRPSKNNQPTTILKSSGSKNEALQDLTQTEAEVQSIYQLFEKQGKAAIALFYDQANKQNLKQHIEGYKYVLLSTHGFVEETADGAISGIYLAEESDFRSQESEKGKAEKEQPPKNERTKKPNHQKIASTAKKQYNNETVEQYNNAILYTSETYNLRLSADLVVLSSCESGIGKMAKGEGMMALNRGFLYAGAANIIYSLFPIPEHATKLLTQHLFEHILAGDSYAEALRKAKTALLKSGEVAARDWAGLVLIGS